MHISVTLDTLSVLCLCVVSMLSPLSLFSCGGSQLWTTSRGGGYHLSEGTGIFQNQETNRTRWRLPFSFLLLFSVDERLELGNHANGKEISDIPSEWKKRTTSGGSPQFPNGFFEKLLNIPFDFQPKFPNFLA